MPYVMVPVPEEHVEEVMQFVLRAIARASTEPWDEASIGKLFAETDEIGRSLLAFVARAAVNGDALGETDAAQMMQLSVRETGAIVRELNEQGKEENRPVLIGRRVLNEVLPNGRTSERRVFTMDEEVAALVRDAERADLLGEVGDSAGSSAVNPG